MASLLDEFEAEQNNASESLLDQFEAEQTAKPKRTIAGTLNDTLITGLKGAIAVPEMAIGLADIFTGGRTGKGAERVGFKPAEAKAILDSYKSEAQKAADAEVGQADGFFDTLKALKDNPSVIAMGGIESLPMMGAGGVIGRGITALAPKVSSMVAGAIGEGAAGAGSAAENLRAQTEDGYLTGKQQIAAAGTGLALTGVSRLGGKVADELGIGDIDTLAAGGAQQVSNKGLIRKMGEGAVVEGALEEAPQSALEKMLENYGLGKEITEGVGNASAVGFATGAPFGAIAQVANGSAPQAPAPEQFNLGETLAALSQANELVQPVEQPTAPAQALTISQGEDADDATAAAMQAAYDAEPTAESSLLKEFEADTQAQPAEGQEFVETEPLPKSDQVKQINKDRHPLKAYGKTLYRETSLSEIRKMAGIVSQDMGGENVYLANKPELAIGQGKNKGVLIEFNAEKLSGNVNTSKPGWEYLWDTNSAGELIGKNKQKDYADSINKITIKDAQTEEAQLFNGANESRLKALGYARRQEGNSVIYERGANNGDNDQASTPGLPVSSMEPQPDNLPGSADNLPGVSDGRATAGAVEASNEPGISTGVDNERDSALDQPAVKAKPARKAPRKNTLLATLRNIGGINFADKMDVTGEDKAFAPGGYNQVFTNKAKSSLRGQIESGNLDDFLPPAMRLSTQSSGDQAYDSAEAYDYIAERIRNGDRVLPYDVEEEIKASQYYANQDVNADIEAFDNEDEINALLAEAGYDERESNTTAQDFEQGSTDRNTVSGERELAREASQSEPAPITTQTERQEVRPLVEQLSKRRAAANQLGKSKQFDTALNLAKEFLNGGIATPAKFKNAATMFANDKPTADIFNALYEQAKAPAKETKQAKNAIIDTYKDLIGKAASIDELQTLAGEIQGDTNLTDSQAQALDNLVFEAQDKFEEIDTEPTQSNADLLGEDTSRQQAIADAERAKDTKRNSGKDNADDFTLSGSDSEADQAAAAGAQSLFDQPATSEDQAATGPINDFGEKLDGAKKDLWRNYQKAMSDELPEDAKEITLSKHFPEPDYENLIASGIDVRSIAAIKAMRDEIAAKPKLPSKLRRWTSELKALREFSNNLIKGTNSLENVLSIIKSSGVSERFAERIQLYAELGYPAFKSAKDYRVTGGWTGFKDGKPLPKSSYAIMLPNGRNEYFDNRESAMDALRAKLSVEPEATERKVKLDIYRVTKTGEVVIGKKVGSRKYIDLKGGFTGYKDAAMYYNANEADLLKLLEQRKTFKPERRSVNDPRVGKDYRQGENVTPEKFAAEFGFRGVQFGNYVEQERRANDLNNAYDALLDLADVVGIPPRAISLNGSLGLAFGARGSGGKNPAAAHYEPGQVVINLTKVNGAGSLGHEWFHAMDNYLSKARGKNSDYVTGNPTALRMRKGNEIVSDDSIRPELLEAFNEMMKAIRASDYYDRAVKRDKTRTKDYWSEAHELAARAFEAYLIDKFVKDGRSNDYLANIAKDDGEDDSYPYPRDSEQAEFTKDFDKIFEVLQTKVTDDGVALFSANRGKGTGTTIDQVQQWINDDIFSHNVTIYPTLADAPTAFSKLAFSRGFRDGDIHGFYDRKTNSVGLVASGIRDKAHAIETARHELIGHYGIETLLGDEFRPLLARVKQAYLAKNPVIYKLGKEVEAKQPGLSSEAKAAEIIAFMAERNMQNSIARRAINAIRKFLKEIGFIKGDITDAEIAGLLREAQAYLRKQGRSLGSQDGEFAFSANTDRKPVTVDTRDNWLFRRDALGNIQLAPTGKAYDVIAEITQNIANKANFGMASPELRKLMRKFKADMQKALDVGQDVAQGMNKMSTEDRVLISDVVEKMVKTNVVPPAHVLDVAANIQGIMDKQTDELVTLGMLSKDAAERWRGKYLPRFYNREKDPALNTFAKKLLRTALPIRGLGGGSLKGRGLYKEINIKELPDFEALGWEVRDPLWKKNRQGKLELNDESKIRDPESVMIWRDYTPEERENMGEMRDSMFRFVMGYTAMQNDIALGRLFDGIAKNQEWTRSRASEGYTKVPDSEIAETGGVKKYGNLAGLYVRDDIMQHITQYEEAGDMLKYYRKALSFWKMGKTVLNPVSHMNNMVSNLSMAHFAGVSYWDTHKYVGALRDFVQGNPMIDEAKDVGLMTGDITRAELIADMPDDIKALMDSKDSSIKRGTKMTFNLFTFGLTRPMSKAYRFEDDFFKYLIYKEARAKGLDPDDAVDYATKYIFNYDDLPKSARFVRDAAIPFFAYTYKAVPALAYTAFNTPWRLAAPALVLSGINAIAYGMIAGDDDDDLAEKYAKGKALEEEERKNLPPWMQGKSALGTPKSIRLGTDEVTGLPIYNDVSRFIPGGDMFDVGHGEMTTLPAPITPSNPIFTTFSALMPQINRDTFTGKDVVDKNDTAAEAAKKRASWMIKQISPAIAPTGYHADRLLNAGAQMADTTIEIPFIGFGDSIEYTGFGKDGLPVQPKYAVMNTLGIKARPTDLELSAEISQGQDASLARTVKAEIRQAARMLEKGAITQRAYDKIEAEGIEKIDRLTE